ncbi:UPF0149 family protein [Pseudomonas sp. BJa5]|uniref:UPF0149 family protein n=1 Tax=Pseudomonas sp. BJa5 TaxID=2936270 RepID=UPI00255A0D25|nr:UPF0149 family protein [Pseudomonas sp. BGr12]MDL2424330.1 UPF0149 family protein [Pseudomonas sp. BGr12]
MPPQPLTASEFEFIEDTLLRYGDDHSVLNLSELDGYLTAMASGPTQVDIAAWFPPLFGDQPVRWRKPEECRRFIDLCVRHLNTLAVQLASAPETFKARFEQTRHRGQPLTLAEEWCFGYVRAVAVSNWPELPEPQASRLRAITDCAEQDNFDLPVDLDVVLHRQRVAAIEPAARALHDYWLTQR